ncbi:hypothetical protein BHC43_05915 [Snodgrassella alvi]|nr:hypothetical protein BHC43_05915 [Snodgrassella alvi]
MNAYTDFQSNKQKLYFFLPKSTVSKLNNTCISMQKISNKHHNGIDIFLPRLNCAAHLNSKITTEKTAENNFLTQKNIQLHSTAKHISYSLKFK